MKEVLPCLNDLPELDSVEVTEPQEIRKPPDLRSSSPNGSNVLAFFKRNAFVVLMMSAVAFGIGLGFALRHINLSARDIKYLTFPGELLMRILQMLVLPLIISSLITGMSSVDRKAHGKIGQRALGFYMVTTVIAAFTGIALALLIQPGKSSRTASVSSSGDAEAVQTVDSFLDLIRNMIPSNLVEACLRKYKTVYSRETRGVVNTTETSENNDRVPVPGTSDGLNLLGLLVFCVAFGLTLGSMETEGKLLRDFFDCLNKTIMRLVNIVIWYSPVGTLFLMAGQIVKMTDTGETGREVAMYCLTVITGLLIHSLFTLPLIYFMVTRKNPFRFMGGLLQALTTAFGTSSSSATLPVTLHCMEKYHYMDKVARFMLPIGATMNMDGAALYEAVAALFIAQVNNMEFNLGQIIVLSLIVTAASTGAAGIPQAGFVSMVIVLVSVGLPTEDISLLLIFDWILDRLRTTTNVLGDCIGVGVVQHLSRHELQGFQL
ncbi:Excitatory amino acid transporter 1 [Larimichthys crocea]|uniref:Amino acid transporter n=1 Tax=Larimichthys crocea TaxID=215358 RepID=A0A6G0IHB1_LARCR|nr:Excitatory amino acid transporter 1 [Larimichthys crocea]